MTFVITRDVEKTHAQREKNIVEMFFSEEIDEKNVEEFFNVERNDLFHNTITQQFCYNDVRETCNNKQ